MYEALLLTGVAGVGKSTVAAAAGSVLTKAGHRNAVVDADALAQFGPSPEREHFYDELKCANLAAVWANFRSAGAQYLVVADSVTTRALYADSLPDCAIHLVHLIADDDTVRRRLRQRDTGPKLEQHLRALLKPASPIDDFTVTNDRPALAVATEILVRLGWVDRPT
ncbi:AAA family ATPase [Actinoplanes bogorensis]|uniref:AAA family ATPase n=1 Tax=Paractinoplanes bogorensis TaxID=1610840 RepID=A0ABS5YYK9_9ACTN|nr:AAA family ATPase [Actinoplanes bogorensis]MBU2668530.1 AAA family ATPase [Actinoplanes bogorensis]